MNLRTIRLWAVYDPERHVIVTGGATKPLVLPSKYPGCVLVKMTGFYVPKKKAKPRRSSTRTKT